jgi:hypothetical protein
MKTVEEINAAVKQLRDDVTAGRYAPRDGANAFVLLRELQDRVNGRDARSGVLNEEPLTAQEACAKIKDYFPEMFVSI